MKPFLLLSTLFLAACNTPQHVLIKDSAGKVITDLNNSSPLTDAVSGKGAGIWYLLVGAGLCYIIWKEFVKPYLDKKREAKAKVKATDTVSEFGNPAPEQPK